MKTSGKVLFLVLVTLAGCSTPTPPEEGVPSEPSTQWELPLSDAPPPLSEAESRRYFQAALAIIARELRLVQGASSGVVDTDTGSAQISGHWNSSYPNQFPIVFAHTSYRELAFATIDYGIRAEFQDHRLNTHRLTGRFQANETARLALNATFGDSTSQPETMDIDFWTQASFHLLLSFVDGPSGRTARYSLDHQGSHVFPAIPLVLAEVPRVTQVVTASANTPLTVVESNGHGIVLRSFSIPIGDLIGTGLSLLP